MRKRPMFRPALDPLEQRLALSGTQAEVDQVGDYQGQFGDQTTLDVPGTTDETGESSTDTASAAVSPAAVSSAKIAPLSPAAVSSAKIAPPSNIIAAVVHHPSHGGSHHPAGHHPAGHHPAGHHH